MAERQAEIEARLTSIQELQGIVSAMRSLAALRMQQAQATIEGIRSFSAMVARALGQALELMPPDLATGGNHDPMARRGVILFCAEHGFVGGFNERVLAALEPAASQPLDLIVVGSRGLLACEERKLSVSWSATMPTQTGGIVATANRIADELYRRFLAGSLSRVEMIFARHVGGGRSEVERRPLLPVALEPFRSAPTVNPPLTNLPVRLLVERLVGEHLFAELAHAVTESFTSENGARLETMQMAKRNIDERLAHLHQTERQLRQEEITSELLELTTGAASGVQF